jgi:hypothetical protein
MSDRNPVVVLKTVEEFDLYLHLMNEEVDLHEEENLPDAFLLALAEPTLTALWNENRPLVALQKLALAADGVYPDDELTTAARELVAGSVAFYNSRSFLSKFNTWTGSFWGIAPLTVGPGGVTKEENNKLHSEVAGRLSKHLFRRSANEVAVKIVPNPVAPSFNGGLTSAAMFVKAIQSLTYSVPQLTYAPEECSTKWSSLMRTLAPTMQQVYGIEAWVSDYEQLNSEQADTAS